VCRSGKEIFVVAVVGVLYIALDFADRDPYIHGRIAFIVCGRQPSM
jgi:hypothetical protein